MRLLVAFLLAASLAGCGSFDGSGLEPGRSRASDVEALMGVPAERVALADGSTRLYFSRLPYGRANYAVTLGPDGVLRDIQQQLTWESIKKISPNATTAKELRELLGPPFQVVRMERQQRDVWEYPWRVAEDQRILWVQVSYDGVVREIIEMHDFASDVPSGEKD